MENKDIWVYAEQEKGVLCETTFELLAKALELKKQFGGSVAAVIIGGNVSGLADTLASYGAERVIAAENKNLEEYKPRPYARALTALASKYQPSVFLFGATVIGRELAPRVMCALHTGLTADAIDLGMDEDGDFVQTTPGFGGNILAHICIKERRPQMVTVRPKVFAPIEPLNGAKAQVTFENIEVEDDPEYQVLDTIPKVTEGASLKDAKIVVSCGRGIKSKEDLAVAGELAELLGGELACSRPLADKGWLPHERQIGQSGCTVKADYIINIGISGSAQYVAGMQKSRCIVSINKNATAPIFGISNYGAAADYDRLLPAIIRRIKGN